MPDTNGAPILETAGLRKQFGDLVAVDDVSFRIRPAARSPSSGVRCGEDHDRAGDRRPGAAHQQNDHCVQT